MNQCYEYEEDVLQIIQSNNIDFIDYGCKDGKTISFGENVFSGKKGLGIDINPEHVEKARQKGLFAICADAANINCPPSIVNFVLLIHFLEHLPTYELAKKCIRQAHNVSRNFLFIKHPWFDSDAELAQIGLKMYWSDWPIHPLHFDMLSIVKTIRRLNINGPWCIYGHDQILDTEHHSIIPIMASGIKDPQYHLKPNSIKLSQPCFKDIACLIGKTKRENQYIRAKESLDTKYVPLLQGMGKKII